ncbi:argininosuccinate lyase [Patulibacter americanus]|uniref:argininosuccinate lyase n=1 Tax=Patulibacter americanus TaxID=588672 RepID=UPI0003B6C708|nr:argininosuccinate lyase [Patulibacter americanus]
MSRFSEPQDPVFRAMNTSLGFDRRMWPQDLRGSRAHARMLAARGIIGEDDLEVILRGFAQIEGELQDGSFPFGADDEDIHMAVERRLTELVGDPGARLHTARSRNDQVATDFALWTAEAAERAIAGIEGLMRTLVEVAEEHRNWPMPAYTHLQRAQPVYLAHHLLAYVWMLERDRARFRFTREQALRRMPLGAGALAGVNFDTDRTMTAAELGFDAPAPNSIDAVSNRDFALDYLGAAATCATHLSRLGQEIVQWASEEFGFLVLPDAWSSGSSLMPQKKNPDCAELLRAKAPRITGHLTALLGVIHALPLTYNKDLQEDKEHVFDAADTLEQSLAAASGMIAGGTFRKDRMAAAAADELLAATDLADELVKRGVPFRQCHAIVGGLVREAVDSGRKLSDLSDDELQAQSPHLGPWIRELLEPLSLLERKQSQGGTSSLRLTEQLELAHGLLA